MDKLQALVKPLWKAHIMLHLCRYTARSYFTQHKQNLCRITSHDITKLNTAAATAAQTTAQLIPAPEAAAGV